MTGVHPAPEDLGDLTLARTTLDRRAERRLDPGLVAGLLADGATRVVEVRDGRAVVDGTDVAPRLRLRPPAPGDTAHLGIYLGDDVEDGTAHVAVVPAAGATGDRGESDPRAGADPCWRTLRQVGAHLTARDAGLFTTAVALANWHARHGHCPRCGARTVPTQGGWVRTCPEDGSDHYPRTDPAVIMSVVDDDERLLLARNPGWARQRYSVLAGFVEPGETLAAAVAREVHEEVGVEVTDVTYLGDQPWPFPASLMVGFTARATGTELVLQPSEIAEARWVGRDELRERVAAGKWGLPGPISIARRLIEHWYGAEIVEPAEPDWRS